MVKSSSPNFYENHKSTDFLGGRAGGILIDNLIVPIKIRRKTLSSRNEYKEQEVHYRSSFDLYNIFGRDDDGSGNRNS